MDILLRTDGNGYNAIIAPAGGYRNMDAPRQDAVWPDGNIRNLYNTYMNGTDVFSFTITEVPASCQEKEIKFFHIALITLRVLVSAKITSSHAILQKNASLIIAIMSQKNYRIR